MLIFFKKTFVECWSVTMKTLLGVNNKLTLNICDLKELSDGKIKNRHLARKYATAKHVFRPPLFKLLFGTLEVLKSKNVFYKRFSKWLILK